LSGRSDSTCSRLRIGGSMIGPRLSMMSKSMPMPGNGVRMSEKRITPSGRKASNGCIEIS
jgi:hypothetical protein